MTINKEAFQNQSLEQYDKKSIEEIYEESKEIDVQVSAKEILIWIANNVEQFIDNKRKRFKLDLVIDAEEGAEETMPMTRKLQNLYRAIPDDPTESISDDATEINYSEIIEKLSPEEQQMMEKIQECHNCLDGITVEIFDAMKNDQEMLDSIFKRMGFYYEMQGISEGDLLIQELTGEVDILQFEYESFPVGVQVSTPKIEKMQEDGSIKKEGGEIKEAYTIPEGFTVWLEIAFKPKNKAMPSLF